jgi:ADP-ribose pyrophosphatase YjhB (NUDIX family)
MRRPDLRPRDHQPACHDLHVAPREPRPGAPVRPAADRRSGWPPAALSLRRRPRAAILGDARRQLLDGETYEAAAARELVEETGFAAPVGALVRTRDEVFEAGDLGPARWIEHYFLVRAVGGTPDRRGWTAEEQRTIRTFRWWPLAELRAADEPVRPVWLPDALASLLADTEKRPSVG